MNWFTWEQHKKWFLITGIFLAIYAAILIPTGISFWHTYQHALATCGQTNSCGQLNDNLFQSGRDQLLSSDVVRDVMLFLPVLFGLFWGVPLISKEYSEGTNLLIWMRSVSRRKWLTVKLIWILAATVIFAGAFTALATWWSRTPNAISPQRFNTYLFNTQGIVPVAYSVFAVAFGILFGTLFKRTMAAIGATLALSVVLLVIVVPNFVRPHYITSVTVTSPVKYAAPTGVGLPSGSWLLSQGLENKAGTISNGDPSNWPSQCQQAVVHGPGGQEGIFSSSDTAINNCLNAHGYRSVTIYQPGSRYWDFQGIESGLYLGAAALAVGATYWLVLKRDA